MDIIDALVVGGMVAGGAYVWQQERGAGVAPAPRPMPQPQPAPGLSGDMSGADIFNLFGGVITGMAGSGAGSNTGSNSGGSNGVIDLFNGLFGFGQGSTVSLPPSGGTGGSTGGGSTGAPVPGTARRLLNLIGSVEAPRGYNQVYGGSRIQPERPITTMTVSEVLAWQDRSVSAGSRSSAAGRYQIIRKTLRSLVRQHSVSMGEHFDADAQDRCGMALLERRGYSAYMAGRISAETFGNRLAQEWAGLPVITGPKAGRSYYGGDGLNNALTTPSAVLAAITGGGVMV